MRARLTWEECRWEASVSSYSVRLSVCLCALEVAVGHLELRRAGGGRIMQVEIHPLLGRLGERRLLLGRHEKVMREEGGLTKARLQG